MQNINWDMIINLLMKHIKRVFVFCFFSCILFSVQKQTVNSVTILGSESIKKSQIYSLMRIKKPTFFSSQEFDPRILRLDIITIKTYYILLHSLLLNQWDIFWHWFPFYHLRLVQYLYLIFNFSSTFCVLKWIGSIYLCLVFLFLYSAIRLFQ